jgi:hypothetical protein
VFEDKFAWLTDPTTADELIQGGSMLVRGVACDWWNLSIPAAKVNHSLCVNTKESLPVRLVVRELSKGLPGMDVNFGVQSRVTDFVAPFVVGESSVNASTFELPPQCTSEYRARLCPAPKRETSARTNAIPIQKIELYLAHPNSTFDVANQDTADALGDVVFLCDEGFARKINGYNVASKWELEVDARFGQYALCNGEPGVCFGGNQIAVGRESAFGAVGKDGGKCTANENIGSWYSMPRAGECAQGTSIGTDGCTWRTLKRLHTLELTCVLNAASGKDQGLDMLKVCAEEKYPPYPKSTKIFESAFKKGPQGCPDVCHKFPACQRGDTLRNSALAAAE